MNLLEKITELGIKFYAKITGTPLEEEVPAVLDTREDNHKEPVKIRRVFDQPQGAISIGDVEGIVRNESELKDNKSLQEHINLPES